MIKLEDYKILKKIGSGGMGDVYLAEHEVLETTVAIKSLHANLVTDESFKKRFRTEAKVHAKLDHPNVVKLIDFHERKDGLFIIMEYVEGKQLDDYINNESGPITEKELIPLFIQIVDAISHAHAKGLVHRDIKPANVIISKGKIKVLDFGIAKEISTESGLTKTGVQVGTPMYMSPEQVNGEKIDKLTDIYSLGVTFFYMAVGKPPYENSNAIKIGIKILTEDFPTAKEFYPGVSNKIETIILKATQKDKKDRYQSCEEFKKDLNSKNIIVSEKVKESTKTEAGEKEKKIKLSTAIAAVIVMFLAFGSLFYFNTNIKEPIELTPKLLGCTDSNATNYNTNAEQDDGTCLYSTDSIISKKQDSQRKTAPKTNTPQKKEPFSRTQEVFKQEEAAAQKKADDEAKKKKKLELAEREKREYELSENRIRKELYPLYEVLKREKAYTKSFSSFRNKCIDVDYQDKIFDYCKRKKLYTKTRWSFKQKYFKYL